MKFVLLVAIVTACIGVQVWASEDDDALTHAASEKCKEQVGVPEEELEQLRAGEFDDGSAHKNVMCFIKCVLDEFDALDGDDKLKEEPFLEYFEPHLGEIKAKEFYDLCNGEVGEGECETPYKISMCLRKSDDIFKI